MFQVFPTHAHGGKLDLMTEVHVLVRAAVVAPIVNSDHSSLSAVISMAQAVPNLFVSRKVFLKHQVVTVGVVNVPLTNVCCHLLATL